MRTISLSLFVLISLTACGNSQDTSPPGSMGHPADLGESPDLSLPDMGSAADDGPATPLNPELEPLRAAILDDLQFNNATAASVAIWHDDKIVWVGGFGAADPAEPSRAPDEQTQFMIGSNTKKIAAIAYLQLVSKGLASLDTTIAQTLPALSFPLAEQFTQATAHELMSHQGGLVDDTGDFPAQTEDAALLDFVSTVLSERAYSLSPPGAFYNYSNPNFSLLGLMTETIAARPWADLVQSEIFAPLEMTRTVARKSSVDPENYAVGTGVSSPQSMNIESLYLNELWEDAYARPAGLVWSTPTDMMKLAKFLVDGDPNVLPDTLRQQLVTPQVQIYPDLPNAYGYGLFIEDSFESERGYYPIKIWSHGGNTLSHTSTFVILPEQRFAISILSNGFQDDFSLSLATAVMTLVDLPEPITKPAQEVNVEELSKLEGTYIDPNTVGRIIITQQGDGLRVKLPDVEAAGVPYSETMTALSTRVWILSAGGASLPISFNETADGAMYLVSRAFVAARSAGLVGLSSPVDLTKLTLKLRSSLPQPAPLQPLNRRR